MAKESTPGDSDSWNCCNPTINLHEFSYDLAHVLFANSEFATDATPGCPKLRNSNSVNTKHTRGQWPYIPVWTRAMRNRHVVLYDLNYPSRYITPNDLGGHLTSDLKSATLIALVSVCILPLMASEALVASKQPLRSFDL